MSGIWIGVFLKNCRLSPGRRGKLLWCLKPAGLLGGDLHGTAFEKLDASVDPKCSSPTSSSNCVECINYYSIIPPMLARRQGSSFEPVKKTPERRCLEYRLKSASAV